MQVLVFLVCLLLVHLRVVHMAAIKTQEGETFFHFDFKTENGQQREEDVKYEYKNAAIKEVKGMKQPNEVDTKPLEFRGGYSFISADGYEYAVKYKANKNGYQPYVTAYKLKNLSTVV